MSADQHKQIVIRGGARSFQLTGGSIKGTISQKVDELRVLKFF
jgi:hypothetical protein